MARGDYDYEVGGAGYAVQRRTDPRIAAQVWRALGDAETVVNVGAGAGSYEPDDRMVIAIEPSERMRGQRPPGRPALRGFAESLPLDDGSVDAAMAMVTVHQWSNLAAGLREMRRVARGPVVVMTADGSVFDQYWLYGYAPELAVAEAKRMPPIDAIAGLIGSRVTVEIVPIPLDCTDGFVEAFYGRPERLLEPAVRKAQSSWGFVMPEVEPRFEIALRQDLKTGRWDALHHHLRWQATFEGSMRLLIGYPD